METLIIKDTSLAKTEKDKYLQIVQENTCKLSVLVEQLFQYTKLEANQVVPEKEQLPLNELASDILIAYQLKAKERSIKLLLDTEDKLPAVFTDIALTERVLQNLLDNAFKFTPDHGSITIQLNQVAGGIKIKVADNGIGIVPEELVYIFERYKQFETGEYNKKGMGIGRAIVKKIMELHHASIEVISEPGKGTAFLFVLTSFSKTIAIPAL